MTIDFLITSLIIVASPGTGALFTIATGLSRGGRAALAATFGCTLGIIPHIAAALGGLAALLHTSALAFQTMKYLGVAYLLFMAYATLRETGALRVVGSVNGRTAGKIALKAFLLNILNPKLSIFFLAFLPQFVQTDEVRPIGHMLELSLIFMIMTFVVFALYGFCAALARDRILGRPDIMAWMRRAFAGAFVALSAKLALSER